MSEAQDETRKLQLRNLAVMARMALVALSGRARADEVPLHRRTPDQVVGRDEKVYLIGVAHVAEVETAFHPPNPPHDAQSVIPRVAQGLPGHSRDSVLEGLDK
jgi:hypothetical protein